MNKTVSARKQPLLAFRRVETWIFDLDNTLYPADSKLWGQVDQRMGTFISEQLNVAPEEAKRIQKLYYRTFGTTLAGLMKHHGVCPERFLEYVHDIDLSMIAPSPALAAATQALPGRKYIFTNGSRRHAERVAERLGVLDMFDGIFDIAAAGYVPKPSRDAYDRFCEACGAQPARAAMFEDLPHNLEMPHALGMVTVLVYSPYFDHPSQRDVPLDGPLPPHVHHLTADLVRFLEDLRPVLSANAIDKRT